MQRYIAFLRAINVGGHVVKMDRLRELFEELGLDDIETFIASGNVIFTTSGSDARALEKRIEDHLQASLGYAVATFLRTPREVAAIAAREPFGGTDGTALSVAFTAEAPSSEGTRKLMTLRSDIDDFHVEGREIYWKCRTKVSDSKFSGAVLEKAIGTPATFRNVTTIRKLAAKYAERH